MLWAAGADPVARYAAFVTDTVGRYRTSALLRDQQPELWALLQVEERRLRTDRPCDWASGVALGQDASRVSAGL